MLNLLLTSAESDPVIDEIVETVIDFTALMVQYAIFGGIIVVGLIVLIILRTLDKRPYMVIAEERNNKLIAKLDKILAKEKQTEAALSLEATKVRNLVGDLVVLAEKEVVENRNVAYDGVATAFKAAYGKLNVEDYRWTKEESLTALSFTAEQLKEAKKLFSEIKK